MKIAYIFQWHFGSEAGVVKKILDQTGQWIEHGVEVGLFILSRKNLKTPHVENPYGIPVSIYEYSSIAERFTQTAILFSHVKAFSPGAVYCRYQLFHPSFKKMAKEIPVFVEINTNDLVEFRLGPKFRYWYNRFTRGYTFIHCTGIICESRQLSEIPQIAKYGKPTLVMGNSIDLQRFLVLPPPRNTAPRLVFLGSAHHSWHGIDKVLLLARYFREWRFDLVGPRPDEFTHKPENVTIHGFLKQPEYELIFARADAALSSLALHRIGKDESSPLKCREYLAYGLPVITAYRDTDFPDGAPFLLRIPNTPDNVIASAYEIENFVKTWIGKRVQREEIGLLDVRVKEQKRLEFLRSLI